MPGVISTRGLDHWWGARRTAIYDGLIIRMTSEWYKAVLLELPKGSRILDIGVGTATALLKNKELLVERDISVYGLDIDYDYIHNANKFISEAGMRDRVQVELISATDFHPSREQFDAVYFSGSLMIIPDTANVLKHAMSLLKDPSSQRIYTTQTFHSPYIKFAKGALGLFKRSLKWVTTIDFGEVTFKQDFEDTVSAAGCEVVSERTLNQWLISRAQMVVLQKKA